MVGVQFPDQFYDMQTRIFFLIGIIGLAILWFGSMQSEKFITLIGIFLSGIGFVGFYYSARRKRGMGFFRRL